MVRVPLSGGGAAHSSDRVSGLSQGHPLTELAQHIDGSLQGYQPPAKPAVMPGQEADSLLLDFFGIPQATPAALVSTPESAAVVEVQHSELVNPITGEIVDETSIDDLIDCYEYIDRKDKQLYAVKQRIKQLLLARTEGDATTRRVAGQRRKAKVTLSAETFDQAVLKTLWARFPELAAQFMRIESLAVQLREFKKLVNTSSDQANFIAFRDALTAAHRGRTGSPSISIEE